MSARLAALSLPLVLSAVLFVSGCAVKIGGGASPGAPAPGDDQPPEEPSPAAPAGPTGTLTVAPGFEVEGDPGDSRRVHFAWEYTNDSDETISRILRWICRAYDDDGYVIATEQLSLFPSGYGHFEPGIKLRGKRTIVVRLDGTIDRVECVPTR